MASQSPPLLDTGQSQLETNYDPACDTGLLFDACAMVDTIDRSGLCNECKRHACQQIYDAFHNTLLNEEDLLAIRHPSKICCVSRGEQSDRLEFMTTTNPDPVLIEEVMGVKKYCHPRKDGEQTVVEHLIDTLFQFEDDTWNLDQCKLWHVLEGAYMIEDAVRGRSIAEFARNHMMLLNRIVQNSLPDQCRWQCYPHLDHLYNVATEGVGMNCALALDSAMRFMDPRVRSIVEHQLFHPGEWPVSLHDEPDSIRVIAFLEKTPAFEACMAALQHQEDYNFLQENRQEWIQKWRDGGQRRAEMFETLPQRNPHVFGMIRSWMSEGDDSQELNKQMDVLEEAIECVLARLQ
ncbi:hypothetical protein MMYC01_209283 [Madurella mycetomatis]|uniref:Uncharacterized protein n=1 Tax=Madurella mycetomatis TaxID=100816 RepID=A0A175VTX7_9PEZI|nr:hypothetical protein MMYC01_209283 [Madurella mycetomatis]